MNTRFLRIAFFITLTFPLVFQATYADETVYGWELMSEQERATHREKMQSFTSNTEREQYRNEHHQKMLKRAESKGVSLSNKPQLMRKAAGIKQDSDKKMIYGWRLMSEKERTEHRGKMRALKSDEEREEFRVAHHQRMMERAKEQGVTLPAFKPQSRMHMQRNSERGIGSGKGGGGGRR